MAAGRCQATPLVGRRLGRSAASGGCLRNRHTVLQGFVRHRPNFAIFHFEAKLLRRRRPLLSAADRDETDPSFETRENAELQSKPGNITREIAAIALPTLAALAADPLAGLVDTAFLGHLGATELAGTAVSLSLFGTATKLINIPLLAVATTSVAAALGRSGDANSIGVARSASSVLIIAMLVGLGEVILLTSIGTPGLSVWGLQGGSNAFNSAQEYLSIRATGAPATIMLLVSQGVFRGLGDTAAPLRATLLANAVNLLLDPLLMFRLELGVRGAAYATVAAEGIACLYLLVQLGYRCNLKVGRLSSILDDASAIAKPTGFLILRTVALSATFAFATSVAARLGVEATATHEVWLASSLLADSLAVAAQSLLARSYAAGNASDAEQVVNRSVQLSLILGLGLAGLLAAGGGLLLRAFSDDPEVLRSAELLFPAVVLIQPLNSLAFVWDGILYGVGGFGYAAAAIPVCVLPSVAVLWTSLVRSDVSTMSRLELVWVALALLMAARSLAIWLPYRLKTGPFAAVGQLLEEASEISTRGGK